MYFYGNYFFSNDIPSPTNAPAKSTPPPAMATPFRASKTENYRLGFTEKIILRKL